MQSDHLDGVLLLVYVIGRFVNFTEAALPNDTDVFELFFEAAGV